MSKPTNQRLDRRGNTARSKMRHEREEVNYE